MDNNILITDRDGILQAEITPDYGGMITSLRMGTTDILFFDETKIFSSPVSAGGIPVLFPFAGKTGSDRYEAEGRIYYMPMHGLVKNRTFAVKSQGMDFVELWLKNDAAAMERNYPFGYELNIFYQIIKESLLIKTRIKNISEKTLIHALGWHPYFKVSDLSAVKLKHYMKTQYDYTVCKDLEAEGDLDLTQPLDHVFCNPIKNEYCLDNLKDGYSVECQMDQAYRSLVVYNGTCGSVCVEPWCGIPDTANNRRFLQAILPGCSKEYTLEFKIKRIEGDA